MTQNLTLEDETFQVFKNHTPLTEERCLPVVMDTTNNTKNPIVSDYLFSYFQTILNVWICLILSSVGVVTNVINLAVFRRQGFKESVNISLATIAFWDLIKCACGVLHRMYGPMELVWPVTAASWNNITLVYLDYTHLCAGYVSCALAAWVSIERCLCVSLPFKVKDIITPRLTLIVVLLTSVVTYGCYIIIYVLFDIQWEFSCKLQSYVAVYRYNAFYLRNGKIVMEYYKTIGILIPTTCFCLIVFCTAVIVYHLRKSSAFRAKSKESMAPNTSNSLGLSKRDKQVVKMLLAVIIVYIVNLFPRVVNYMVTLAVPEFYILKTYHNIFMIVGSFLYVLDFINASVNLFIFLRMSSQFRSTFNQIFLNHSPKLNGVKW